MHLYLRHGKKLSTITDILLKDFHTPAVGSVEIDHIVEPAIWYKTLIIDAVFIDCDVRNLFWREKSSEYSLSSECDTESTRLVPRMTRAVYEEGDCEDFELFVAVEKFLNAIEHKSFGEGKRAQEILRILHLYVLPEIVLKKQDIDLLQDAFTTVEVQIENVSEEIQHKDRGIYLTENSLRTQRDRIFSLNNFESEIYVNTCDVGFLGELLFDIEKDIESRNYELEACQSEVNRLRNAVTDEGKANLAKLRQKRDDLCSSIHKYQAVRETIKNVTVRTHSKKRNKCEPNVFHAIYLELKGRLLKEKQLVKHCCDLKLKITSVREAIVQVRDELLHSCKDESYGFETSREGQGTATDILEANNNKPSNWQTVEQIVKLIIHDGTSGPSMALKAFCDSIITKIKLLLNENEFFQNCHDSTEEKQPKQMEDSDEFVNISYRESIESSDMNELQNTDRLSIAYRPFTHTIKEDILKHIDDQCRWLLNNAEMAQFTEKGKHVNIELPHKIWVCYETQLYNLIMAPLSQLYYVSYVDVASNIKDFIGQKTLLELGIDEPWLSDDVSGQTMQTFHANGEVTGGCISIGSLKSGLSITLGRMTLEELYESAQKDCQDIPEYLDCPLDEDVFDFDSQSVEGQISSSYVENENDKRPRSSIITECNTVSHMLQPACNELENCIQTTAVVEKLKSMTKAYRLVSRKVSKLKSRYRRDSVESMVCCDEILSSSIVLLKLLKREHFIQVYSHLNLMIDLMPPFLTGSVHDCSLTNFYSAYQYLFDKQVSIRVSR